ncbi:MAG: hypothetical protein IJM01_07900 [Eubacterium sp.]|nr:hypothetical protein [Eubacterium sp.]
MKSYITDKPLKTISVEGCESIGRGAHGEVFRIAPDTAVKVYYPDITMDRIERELNYAQKAFVKGVPTAISFDIVRVGDRYGAVFELATLYVTYKQFPKINEMAVRIFGLTSEKSSKMWDSMIRLYTGYTDEAELTGSNIGDGNTILVGLGGGVVGIIAGIFIGFFIRRKKQVVD